MIVQMNNYQKLTDRYGDYYLNSFTIQNKEPMVSIIMSVHNGMPFLIEAMKSVQQQTWTDFEFIIINDGSSDDSGGYIEKNQGNDKRIILIKQSNLGLTKSLNRGIKISKGEYIARIDADDIWHKDKLAKQIKYLEAHPNCALLGTAYQRIDANGAYLGEATIAIFNSDNLIRDAITKFNPFFHSSVIFRRDACMQLGGYDEFYRYAQDYNLWVRFIAKYSVANLPEILAFQRITQDNISIKKERKQRWYALKSKLLAIKLLKLNVLHYYHLLNNIAIIILPTSLVKLIRILK